MPIDDALPKNLSWRSIRWAHQHALLDRKDLVAFAESRGESATATALQATDATGVVPKDAVRAVLERLVADEPEVPVDELRRPWLAWSLAALWRRRATVDDALTELDALDAHLGQPEALAELRAVEPVEIEEQALRAERERERLRRLQAWEAWLQAHDALPPAPAAGPLRLTWAASERTGNGRVLWSDRTGQALLTLDHDTDLRPRAKLGPLALLVRASGVLRGLEGPLPRGAWAAGSVTLPAAKAGVVYLQADADAAVALADAPWPAHYDRTTHVLRLAEQPDRAPEVALRVAHNLVVGLDDGRITALWIHKPVEHGFWRAMRWLGGGKAKPRVSVFETMAAG